MPLDAPGSTPPISSGSERRIGGGVRTALAVGLSLVIGAVFLWLAGRELEFDKVGAWLRSADLWRLSGIAAAYALMFLGVMCLRAVRWRYLMRHLGEFRTRDILAGSFVGFAAIVLFPLRLGELVRPYAIARRTGCSISALLGTAVVERVVDGICVTGLLFATIATYAGGQSTAFVMVLGWIAAGVFTGALGGCLVALWRRDWTMGLVRRFTPSSVGDRVTGLLASFLDGIDGLRRGSALVPFLVTTVAYWVLNGLTIGFLASYGFGLALSPWEALTVLSVLVVGIMIPAGPGMAGNYELFTLEALGLFCAREDVLVAGAAFVATMHAIQFVVQVVPGMLLAGGGAAGLVRMRHSAIAAAENEAPRAL